MTLTKQQREQGKKELAIKQAQKNLASACEILGWDEEQRIRVLQAKDIVKSCRNLDSLDALNLGTAIYLIAGNKYLQNPLKEIYDLVNEYLSHVANGNLRDLDGNRGDKGYVGYIEEFSEMIRKNGSF